MQCLRVLRAKKISTLECARRKMQIFWLLSSASSQHSEPLGFEPTLLIELHLASPLSYPLGNSRPHTALF
ncbi:hypothetical protein Y032_0055g2619 [Ancylostoma ceylanicum]|uniref:Uncharacterized protein n=1 Tax=Ancylostoma ceylanicum TaxID=53326 RepID=A0A016U6V9_9BILA|nr:hypothetical protein Y032_0055g2619 [Ancylostoma ceylanicum]